MNYLRGHYLLCISVLLCCVLAVYGCLVLSHKMRDDAVNVAVEHASGELAHLKELRRYYAKNVMGKLLLSQDGAFPASKNNIGRVHNLTAEISNKQQEVRLYSPFSFAGRTAKELNKAEKHAWEALMAQPEEDYRKLQWRDGRKVMYVARADVMSDMSCVNCHNNHPDSIKTNWQLGDVRGVLEAVVEIEPIIEKSKLFFVMLLAGCVGLMSCVVVVCYYVMRRKTGSGNLLTKGGGGKIGYNMLNATSHSIVVANEQGDIVSFNKAAEAMFLYKANEVVGKNVAVVMPPEFRKGHQAYIERYLKTNTVHILGVSRELEGAKKNGDIFPLELTINEVLSEDGRLFIASMYDLSDRYEAEQVMLRSKQEFEVVLAEKTQRLMEEMVRSEAINMRLQKESSLVRLLHEITVAVSAVESREEAVQVCLNLICGYTWWIMGVVYIVNDAGEPALCESKYLAIDSLDEFDVKILEDNAEHKDGGMVGRSLRYAEPIWVSDITFEESVANVALLEKEGIASVVALPIEVDGAVVGVMQFFADAVQDYNDQLIRTISSIGTQLGRAIERYDISDKVLKAKTDAELANISKSELLTKMSYEFRTPLHNILDFAKMSHDAIGQENDEKIIAYIDGISEGGNQLLRLLTSIIDASKLKTITVDLAVVSSNMADLLNAAMLRLEELYTKKSLSIDIQVSDVIIVESDVKMIEDVLYNILYNAVRFSYDGGKIVVNLHKIEDNGVESVCCYVQDKGVGLPLDDVERVFSDDKVVMQSQEEHIGLAACREILHMHHGRIWLDKPEGWATRVSFVFPLVYSVLEDNSKDNAE